MILVRPYFSNELNENQRYYYEHYDDIIIPDVVMGVHYKSAIQTYNKWVVDQCAYIISGVYRDFGGAYQTTNYVKRQGKTVINVAKK